jgi:hypothetical protein
MRLSASSVIYGNKLWYSKLLIQVSSLFALFFSTGSLRFSNCPCAFPEGIQPAHKVHRKVSCLPPGPAGVRTEQIIGQTLARGPAGCDRDPPSLKLWRAKRSRSLNIDRINKIYRMEKRMWHQK